MVPHANHHVQGHLRLPQFSWQVIHVMRVHAGRRACKHVPRYGISQLHACPCNNSIAPRDAVCVSLSLVWPGHTFMCNTALCCTVLCCRYHPWQRTVGFSMEGADYYQGINNVSRVRPAAIP